MAGTEKPCLAVAVELGLAPDIKRIKLRLPWKIFSPWLGHESSSTFEPPLAPPWPDMVITSGRKAVGAARYIKTQKPDCFALHIQDPRAAYHVFDLIAVPAHDRYRGNKAVVTHATPTIISPSYLSMIRHQHIVPVTLSSPRVAVLIGGNSKTHQLSTERTSSLIGNLQRIEGSVLMTVSRRTPEESVKALKEAFDRPPHLFYDGEGDNPYELYLAWADVILVTEDSVSMLSDACSTGKPVYKITMDGGSAKFNALYEVLGNQCGLRDFDDQLDQWAYTPLNDTKLIADAVRKRWNHE